MTLLSFLAHLAKGNVSFCHHLVSIVCRPLTFHILIFSSETPQPNEVKLGRKHIWKVFYKEWAVSEEKIFRNRLIRNKNCLWRPCLLMDHGRNRQLLFLIGWFFKFFSSETVWPNELKLVFSDTDMMN
jgi:hypothetical protein